MMEDQVQEPSNPEDGMSGENPATFEATSEETPAPVKRGVAKGLSIALGVIILLVGGAIAVFALKSGSGTQPEELLPANTVAYAKLDFNPSASQKIDFVRFVSRFPNTFKNFDANSPIDSFLRATNKQIPAQWPEVKSWLGDRYAIAAIEAQGKIMPVLVLAMKNEGEMRSYIEKTDPQIHIDVAKGYALLSPSQAALDVLANAKTHLSEDSQYKSDIAALGGDQVAVAWGNVKELLKYAENGVVSLVPNSNVDGALAQLQNLNGRIVLGLHFTSKSLALTLLTRDFTTNSAANLPLADQTVDIGDLPSDTLASIGINGIGEALSKSLATVPSIDESLKSVGINSLELQTLFSGAVTLIALPGQQGKNPDIALRITPTNIPATSAVLEKLVHGSNSVLSLLSIKTAIIGNHIYVGLDSQSLNNVVTRISDTTTPLRSDTGFKSAVTQTGYIVAYVNLHEVIPLITQSNSFSALNGLALTSKVEDAKTGNSRTLLILTLT